MAHQIASPGEAAIPGVACSRCGRKFSVRIQYAIRTDAALPMHSGVADIPLALEVIGVEAHECVPPSGQQLEFDQWAPASPPA